MFCSNNQLMYVNNLTMAMSPHPRTQRHVLKDWPSAQQTIFFGNKRATSHPFFNTDVSILFSHFIDSESLVIKKMKPELNNVTTATTATH